MESRTGILPHPTSVDNATEKTLSATCRVCGEINAKLAYGVLSCSSCRIFFRRNIELDSVSIYYLIYIHWISMLLNREWINVYLTKDVI